MNKYLTRTFITFFFFINFRKGGNPLTIRDSWAVSFEAPNKGSVAGRSDDSFKPKRKF